eukprot:762896-Pyramimonas_sp.AAC.1
MSLGVGGNSGLCASRVNCERGVSAENQTGVRSRSPGGGCSSSPPSQAPRVSCEELSHLSSGVRTQSPGLGCSSSPMPQAR